MPSVTRTAALLAGLFAFASAAADVRGGLRGWLAPGVDTNARREFVSPGGSILTDAFLAGLVQAEGRLTLVERLRLWGEYGAGARGFLLVPSESHLVQTARLAGTASLFPWLALGLQGSVRDRRGADRDYTDLTGGAAVELVPEPSVNLRLELAARRFLYRPRFAASWWGPDGVLTARLRVDRRHTLAFFGQYNPRTYNASATPAPRSPAPLTVARADAVLGAGASWSYRGGFRLTVSYAYLDQTSNSWGETIRRHRFSVTGGVQLPWKLTALATGVLQLASYPDGVYLSPDLTVMEDDDYGSSVTAKLVRPLGDHVDLELRYAFFYNQMPANHFTFARHVASVGVAVSW